MCEKTEKNIDYPRKTLYLSITIPMLMMYIAVAVFLWGMTKIGFVIYISLFLIVAIFQSYVCVYFECPYIGKFAPCVGGFCLPSSRIACLLKEVKPSERLFNIAVNIAFLAFASIIFFPIYFLYQQNLSFVVVYLMIVLVYAFIFLGWVCPVCATRRLCPGGQLAERIRKAIMGGR